MKIKTIACMAMITVGISSEYAITMELPTAKAEPVPHFNSVDSNNNLAPTAVRATRPSEFKLPVAQAQLITDHTQNTPVYDAQGQQVLANKQIKNVDGIAIPVVQTESLPLAQQARNAFNYLSSGRADQGFITALTGEEPMVQAEPAQLMKTSRTAQYINKNIDLAPEGYYEEDSVQQTPSINLQEVVSPTAPKSYIQQQNERLDQAQLKVKSIQDSFASDPSMLATDGSSITAKYQTRQEMNQAATMGYLRSQSSSTLAELLLTSPIKSSEKAPISKSQVWNAITASMADFVGITRAAKAYANFDINKSISNISSAGTKTLNVILVDRTTTDGVKQTRINQLLQNTASAFKSLADQLGVRATQASDFVSGSKTTIIKDTQGNVVTKNVIKPDGSTIEYQYQNGKLQTKTEISSSSREISTNGKQEIVPEAPIKKTTYFKNGREIGTIKLQNVAPNERTRYKPAVNINYSFTTPDAEGVRQEIIPDGLQNAEPVIDFQDGQVIISWKSQTPILQPSTVTTAQPTLIESLQNLTQPKGKIGFIDGKLFFTPNNVTHNVSLNGGNIALTTDRTIQPALPVTKDAATGKMYYTDQGKTYLISEKNSNLQNFLKDQLPEPKQPVVEVKPKLPMGAGFKLSDILPSTDKKFTTAFTDGKWTATTQSAIPLTFVYDENSSSWTRTN